MHIPNCSNQSIQKIAIVTTRDLRVETFEVLNQGYAQGASINYFAKFSQKLTCLAPDKDIPVRFITGQSIEKLTLIRAVKVSEYLVTDRKIDHWLRSHVRKPSDDSTATPTRRCL